MPSIGEALKEARAALKQALTLDEREAGLEVHILLGRTLGQSRAWLLAHGEDALDANQESVFQRLLVRRLQGEPIAYILGEREFFGLNLRVTPDVLIPRPDTELLVELALAHATTQAPCDILDLGTGSGAVAIAIARQCPAARVTAVDQSESALAVARENAQRHCVANVRFLQGNWFAPLRSEERFDLIVGNPPYIADQDPHLVEGDLRFEPRSALVSGVDGLDDIRHIAAATSHHLKPGGWLMLEHGFDQGARNRSIFEGVGLFSVETHRDLAGKERITSGKRA